MGLTIINQAGIALRTLAAAASKHVQSQPQRVCQGFVAVSKVLNLQVHGAKHRDLENAVKQIWLRDACALRLGCHMCDHEA